MQFPIPLKCVELTNYGADYLPCFGSLRWVERFFFVPEDHRHHFSKKLLSRNCHLVVGGMATACHLDTTVK